MLGESLKLSEFSRKPTKVSLPRDPSQIPMHPRAVEPDGMRSKRSPLGLVTRQGKALKKEFLRWLGPWERPQWKLRHPIALIPLQTASAKRGQSEGYNPSIVDYLW